MHPSVDGCISFSREFVTVLNIFAFVRFVLGVGEYLMKTNLANMFLGYQTETWS